jgi:ubiquinol-cytochrome c reductase cytochrome b subunit
VANAHLIEYPAPSNLNVSWNFGSLAGICLIVQIATGVFLAMHYTPSAELAFASVQRIMRDVPGGWILRYTHANGASLFFIVIYLHVFRALYYSSYSSPRETVWLTGLAILLLMIVTGFLGYVLPWASMSFWAATVITSLFSAIPLVGGSIVSWLWGGFSVGNATLNRFYSLHYLLPFGIAGLSIIHLAALHQYGSTNPVGVNAAPDTIPFYPYYVSKDVVGICFMFFALSVLVFFSPDILSHPDNFVPADALVTPAHIVPEWYFLWVYAILRSIPNKLGGVASIVAVFVCLGLLPFLHKGLYRSPLFRSLHEQFFWVLLAELILLSWLGAKPIEQPYVLVGQVISVAFFLYLIYVVPSQGRLEGLVTSFLSKWFVVGSFIGAKDQRINSLEKR